MSTLSSIRFKRTLRIPDDNRAYPLPPDLGVFTLERVEDHASRLPAGWAKNGGVLFRMYQAEALWILLSGNYPFAVKVAAGKINAVTGEAWKNDLASDQQDYLVVPDQRWLDGFCIQKGIIRQFVAMPLGEGYAAEEQLTGTAEHGGLQIIVYPMKRERYEESRDKFVMYHGAPAPAEGGGAMGLAPGGLMWQTIYEDHYGHDAWDTSTFSRCFVHILNSTQWQAATGKPVLGKPPTAAAYTKARLPWFDYYDEKLAALNGAEKLANLDSVAAKGVKQGETPLPDNDPVQPKHVVTLGPGPEVFRGSCGGRAAARGSEGRGRAHTTAGSSIRIVPAVASTSTSSPTGSVSCRWIVILSLEPLDSRRRGRRPRRWRGPAPGIGGPRLRPPAGRDPRGSRRRNPAR